MVFKKLKRIVSFLNLRSASLKKLLNFMLVAIQWKFIKNSRVFSYPIKLTICTGNICNLRCPLCPSGKKQKGRKIGFMTFECFKKIIDECGSYLYEIDLFSWGEPLLNKDIFRMIRYAKRSNIKIIISSNLYYFNENICNNLVNSGLDDLIISLDGASQKSVSKYQKGNDFKKIINNMKKIIEKKNKMKTKTPFVQWRFLVNKYNEIEIEKAKKIAKKLNIDRLEITEIRCDMAQELFLDNRSQFENVKCWLPKNELLSGYDYSKKTRKKTDNCDWLWAKSTINWNGSVSACCGLWYEKFDFGNINNSSFFKIWNNKMYQEARKIVRGDKINSLKNICFICNSNKTQT